MEMKKRVFLYVRVSTQEQAKEGYSIDEQINRLRDYCKAMEWTIVKVYTDAGYSGSNTDRPALQSMIDDIKAKKGDSVVVYKLDRLSRSQKDTLELIEDCFLANNVGFISMTENFDTSTPFGRAMIGILSVFAQLEREQIKERVSMGREGRAKDGKFHGGGYEPIGYDYVDGELKVNEFEAMQIREIHRLYQEGKGFHTIERIFAERGYSQKFGKWQIKRIKRCMLNDLYIGNIHFNDQVYKGTHDPIVDEQTYHKSVALYQSRDYSKYKHHGRNTCLGGLLYCGHCHARYSVATYKVDGKTYRYYSCYSRRKTNRNMVTDPTCMNKNWKLDDLDQIVFDEIRKLAIDPSYVHMIRQKNCSDDDLSKEIVIKKEIAKIDYQKSRFMDLYGLGEFTLDEVQRKVAPLNDQKKKLENELSSLASGKSALSEDDALKLIESFEDVINEADFEQTRLLINALIEKIEIDNEDITIHWKFA